MNAPARAGTERTGSSVRRRGLVLALICATCPALSQEAAPPPTRDIAGPELEAGIITVEGGAHANVTPDTAVIAFGVVTERLGASDATAENDRAVRAVLDAIAAAGIDAGDVRTMAVDLFPLRDNPAHGQPRIVGFRADHRLEVRVSPIDKAGQLVGEMMDKGVNAIEGVGFTARDDPALDDRLRGEAMRDARHKAEVYLAAFGLKPGRVLSVATPGAVAPEPPILRARPAVASAPPMPLAGGAEERREAVSVTFEIAQGSPP